MKYENSRRNWLKYSHEALGVVKRGRSLEAGIEPKSRRCKKTFSGNSGIGDRVKQKSGSMNITHLPWK